ncbi:MAG TPA: rod shape-determining protein MreC [Streptosporangiaceae bacterium]
MRDTRRTRLLLSIALATALALIAIDYSSGSSSVVGTVRDLGGSLLGGSERTASTVTGPVGRFIDSGLAGSGGSGARVAALQQQVIRLRAELSAASLRKSQYRQLDRLLQVAGKGGYRVVAASVIAFGQGYQQTVTLDAGSADGVRPQQTVIDGSGLVGRVVAVSGSTCTVQLASDPGSVVGVRLAPGGQIGWVTGGGRSGSGAGLLRLQVLDAQALAIGTPLVTAASVRDRPFVPGVPVGTIVSVRNRSGALTGQALVRPYADFSALNVVGIVIAPPRRNPRYSVLPPRPRPTPSPAPSGSASPGPSVSPAHPSPRPGHS